MRALRDGSVKEGVTGAPGSGSELGFPFFAKQKRAGFSRVQPTRLMPGGTEVGSFAQNPISLFRPAKTKRDAYNAPIFR
jgi:hypothetical protein